jgi:hypothetical protein
MSRLRAKGRKIIELFDEKTGSVIRRISFQSPKEFEEFLKGFKEMRYPGYGWRYIDKGRKQGKNNQVNHHQKT